MEKWVWQMFVSIDLNWNGTTKLRGYRIRGFLSKWIAESIKIHHCRRNYRFSYMLLFFLLCVFFYYAWHACRDFLLNKFISLNNRDSCACINHCYSRWRFEFIINDLWMSGWVVYICCKSRVKLYIWKC